MRHHRIFVVDDHDRTVRVAEQAGTDRTEQPARPPPTSETTHDHQHCVFGHVDQCGNGCRRNDFTVDRGGTSAQRSLFNHLECVVDQVAPVILLPSQHARRQWHLQPGGYFRRHRVHERQRDFSQLRIPSCPPHRNLCGR
ncbi:Uncharacterised protein [Mycobacterium tuberculosis]|uniref:Uncharacterized protein n=1 Tax=Mycobacterium tuberculosis TaxID=1773 RepID=A0A916L973_MYCTX|nr:Uncharacterised protein [Mycobacterium tuberculosis]COW43855.1 Uncharacterised protein [Mycobacterium tuberculosis]COX34970.1 Uncharacterised protein [Mycobacterium tuberculosis]